jgi:prepilin-type N-terminal cleavage/methylation domain-containing protein
MNKGFTLVELIVVIIVILILSAVSVPMFSSMFQSHGVSEASSLLVQALSNAREMAARDQAVFFIEFKNVDDTGQIRIFKDKNNNKTFEPATDTEVTANPMRMPTGIIFYTGKDGKKKYPDWISFSATGYCAFPAGFATYTYKVLEPNFAGQDPQLWGDIIIASKDQPEKACIDINEIIGEVAEIYFVRKEE